MTATEIETYHDQHSLLQRGTPPAWLDELRQRGINAFERLGFPTRRLEDWRVTNLAPFVDRPYQSTPLATDDLASASEEIRSLIEKASLDESFHQLVFINGRYSEEWSRLHEVPATVTLSNLANAMVERPEDVEAQLTRGLDFEASAFAALNTGFVEDGGYIDIPDGVALDRPIHLLFITTGIGRIASHPRNLVRIGNGSSAHVIESYWGYGDPYFTNSITQASLCPNAELDHDKLQHEQIGALHIAQSKIEQAANSRFRSHYFSFGASLARNELNCLLDGEQIETTLNGLYMPKANQLMDCRSRIDHAKPNCDSHELYKGILADNARGVFNGKIFVHPDAQKTDAKQSNQALLLSDDAQVNTKPQLEIYADDVRCTHGATIGELEEDSLYYLRSRGIPLDLAREILIFAFANDVVQGVRLPAVRRHLESILISDHELSEDIL